MILDEPMDGLDPVMRRQIWSIILSKASESRTTILISSHNLRELEDVCDHVGIMHQGKIIVERSLSDLQGNVSKIQVAFQEGMPTLPKDFENFTHVQHRSCIHIDRKRQSGAGQNDTEADTSDADRYPSSYIGRNFYL